MIYLEDRALVLSHRCPDIKETLHSDVLEGGKGGGVLNQVTEVWRPLLKGLILL